MNKTREERIYEFTQQVASLATAASKEGIPFMAVVQINDGEFTLAHYTPEHAHNEMKESLRWWIQNIDGKVDEVRI